YNNTPKLRQVSLKLLQLAANLRDWLDLEGIISYYGWPGKAPVAFTLTSFQQYALMFLHHFL
ncbi:MAG: hypothetical protein IJH70_10410, partial [Oscillospiraceae bacterium]|nr:hypothetical protein [Oscillospiraceae bacterium]